MTSGWQQKNDESKTARAFSALGRGALVFAVLLGFFLLNLVPFRLFGVDSVRPPFLLMAVFYWTIFRPGLLRVPVVFFMGVMLDALSGWPLGVSALLLLAVQWVTLAQRKFFSGQSFLIVWWGYLLLSGFSLVLQWGAFSLFHTTLLPVMPVAIGGMLGLFIFPFAVLPLYIVHRTLSEPRSLV